MNINEHIKACQEDPSHLPTLSELLVSSLSSTSSAPLLTLLDTIHCHLKSNPDVILPLMMDLGPPLIRLLAFNADATDSSLETPGLHGLHGLPSLTSSLSPSPPPPTSSLGLNGSCPQLLEQEAVQLELSPEVLHVRHLSRELLHSLVVAADPRESLLVIKENLGYYSLDSPMQIVDLCDLLRVAVLKLDPDAKLGSRRRLRALRDVLPILKHVLNEELDFSDSMRHTELERAESGASSSASSASPFVPTYHATLSAITNFAQVCLGAALESLRALPSTVEGEELLTTEARELVRFLLACISHHVLCGSVRKHVGPLRPSAEAAIRAVKATCEALQLGSPFDMMRRCVASQDSPFFCVDNLACYLVSLDIFGVAHEYYDGSDSEDEGASTALPDATNLEHIRLVLPCATRLANSASTSVAPASVMSVVANLVCRCTRPHKSGGLAESDLALVIDLMLACGRVWLAAGRANDVIESTASIVQHFDTPSRFRVVEQLLLHDHADGLTRADLTALACTLLKNLLKTSWTPVKNNKHVHHGSLGKPIKVVHVGAAGVVMDESDDDEEQAAAEEGTDVAGLKTLVSPLTLSLVVDSLSNAIPPPSPIAGDAGGMFELEDVGGDAEADAAAPQLVSCAEEITSLVTLLLFLAMRDRELDRMHWQRYSQLRPGLLRPLLRRCEAAFADVQRRGAEVAAVIDRRDRRDSERDEVDDDVTDIVAQAAHERGEDSEQAQLWELRRQRSVLGRLRAVLVSYLNERF